MKDFFFSNNENFYLEFSNFLEARATISSNIKDLVSEIIRDVKKYGDKALIDYTKKFDQVNLSQEEFLIEEPKLKKSIRKCLSEDKLAIEFAIKRITDFHEKQLPKDTFWKDGIEVYILYLFNFVKFICIFI